MLSVLAWEGGAVQNIPNHDVLARLNVEGHRKFTKA